jgi:hypothetical protein
MLKFFNATLLLFLALGVIGLVQAQTEMCRLTVSSIQRNPFQASSRELVGEFPLTFENDKLARELRHEESRVQISMGVEIFEGMSKTRVIRLGISFQREGNDSVFEALDGVEAQTFYDKNWRALSVSKNIEKTNRIYTFQFSCEKTPHKKR